MDSSGFFPISMCGFKDMDSPIFMSQTFYYSMNYITSHNHFTAPNCGSQEALNKPVYKAF